MEIAKRSETNMSERREQPAPSLIPTEAERAVLGKLIIDDRLWWDIADRLKPEDFGVVQYGGVFRAMKSLIDAARPITIPGILACLGEEKRIDTTDASNYLHAIWAEVGSPRVAKVPILQFVDIVVHRSGCRKIVAAADQIKSEALVATLDQPIEDIRQSAARLLAESETEDSTDDEKLGDLVSKVVSASAAAKATGKRTGIRTGFPPFDELAGSLFDGNLIVLAGETGSGKTALATQLGICLAEQGIPVRMTSLEMEGKELATRVLSTFSAIQSENISDGTVSEDDLDRMMRSGERVFGLPFWIDGKPKQSIGTIQARLARAKTKYGVKVGIIDHLQYVKSDLTRAEERQQIAQVVDDCKAMAKRLQMVIILISHVSRQVDFATISTAADIRRPTLSNLFGSSAIEKAADVTVFVHRPYWFLERATPTSKKKEDHAADLLKWEGLAELVMPKRRSGKGFGVRTVYFNEQLTWFSAKELPSLKDDQLELLG